MKEITTRIFSTWEVSGLLTINNNIRNERDYVDLIQAPIHDNKVVAWYEITDKYINVNDQEDLEFLFSTWNK